LHSSAGTRTTRRCRTAGRRGARSIDRRIDRRTKADLEIENPCASHARHVDAFTDWILRRIDELAAEDQGLPLVVPVTVTFAPMSTRSDQVLREYERFYARLCSRLINNYERPSKRHLLPFALAFRDDPSTRPNKHRDRPSAFAVFSNHPSVVPHVHSLIVVHPSLADRFLEIVPSLEATWRAIPVRTAGPVDAPTYANRTLYADVSFAREICELMAADPVGSRALVRARIRRVVDYCAKLGRRRDVDVDVDLFIVLPTSRPDSVNLKPRPEWAEPSRAADPDRLLVARSCLYDHFKTTVDHPLSVKWHRVRTRL